MPRYDFRAQRLHVDTALETGTRIELDKSQVNYLLNVLRLKRGADILLFNGTDGEWRASVEPDGRRGASLVVHEQTRKQTPSPDLRYLFAPLKQARLEYMVQKAVEMGAGYLQPVVTQHTHQRPLRTDRMRSHAIEAAEQCGILTIPHIEDPRPLVDALDALPGNCTLVFCDEGEVTQDPLTALQRLGTAPFAVLVGPEGGFSQEERLALKARPGVVVLPLGPRILRADTAAVAALALVQAVAGDWRDEKT